ncbi:hypothetical protein SEA_KRADAL_205 [Streptomyces phage Kradal]|nr:hypothetical protein SEA_KRADAL_205 [Streptomyces phage Kradal]QPL14511.1 hypothetical protein SEA_EHYELIMAYOE_206 [Streptomyces phage EhyElimayoE]
MGKTAHHLKGKFDTREWPDGYRMYWRGRPVVPVREHIVHDLRYSAAELRTAEEQGRRPQPNRTRRTARWWTYTGAWTPSSSRTFWAGKHERANRRYVKSKLNAGRRTKGELERRMYEAASKTPRRMLYDIW